MKPLSILLVDGDDEVRCVVSMLLTKAGHGVSAVADTRTALALMPGREFDVILTDSRPDGRDCAEFLEAVRSRQPAAGLVVMDGAHPPMRHGFCVELGTAFGVCAGLRKPFSLDELLASVENARCNRRQEAALAGRGL